MICCLRLTNKYGLLRAGYSFMYDPLNRHHLAYTCYFLWQRVTSFSFLLFHLIHGQKWSITLMAHFQFSVNTQHLNAHQPLLLVVNQVQIYTAIYAVLFMVKVSDLAIARYMMLLV